MIVIYSWRTIALGKSTTYWEGVFLFGIIPIAIWVLNKTYRT
jgi:hypothetical protein